DETGTPSQSSELFSPLQLQTAYHVTPLLQQGYNGAGQTIAIATFAPYNYSDPATFASLMGLPNVQLAPGFSPTNPFAVVDGSGNSVSQVVYQTGSDETTVDMEWSHAFAPGATQEVAVGDTATQPSTPQQFYDVYQALASGSDGLTVPNVITCSWAYPEAAAPVETNQILDQMFASVAAQGITMFFAAGDGNVQSYNVMYPSSDPFVIAVGGTNLALNTNGTIASEKAWGNPPYNSFYTASTGGYSTEFAAPPWAAAIQEKYVPPSSQLSPTVPYLPGMRGVPDVSLNALNFSAIYQGGFYGFLGTSLSSPSWAGIYADMNQMAIAKTGKSLGYLAPQLYQVSQMTPSPFHDITQGNNGEFSATPGWDPVTGLGTPDVAALANDLITNLQAGTSATL
ncbi:Peptidase S53 propeptide, partial [mine drainage metagenome]